MAIAKTDIIANHFVISLTQLKYSKTPRLVWPPKSVCVCVMTISGGFGRVSRVGRIGRVGRVGRVGRLSRLSNRTELIELRSESEQKDRQTENQAKHYRALRWMCPTPAGGSPYHL
jgi:hypothetical protein